MIKRIETELGLLPEHWSVSSVEQEALYVTDYVANGSFASLRENVTYKSSPDYAVLIRLVDFTRNFSEDFVYVDEHSYNFLRKSNLRGGEIIISNVGEYAGTVFRAPNLGKPMTLGPNAIMMEFKGGNDFYYYWFTSPNGQTVLQSIRTGSAVPKFNKTDFRNSKIPVPPLPEQQAIAEILRSLDDKINLLHRQNKTLEALAETLFRRWFVEEANESWEVKKVSNVCKIITKGTTPTTLGHRFTESGINFIKAESLTDDGVILENKLSYISEETHNFLNRSKIEANDLVLTIAGTVGRVAIVPERFLPANTNQAVAILRASDEVISHNFLYCLFKSDAIRNDFEGRVVHAVQPNLSLGEIGSIIFRLPPANKLVEGEKHLDNLFKKKESNNIQISTLTKLRDTLLPKLMSGEVRVKIDETETALAG